MALYDFWLFPRLKMPLKGTRFHTRRDVIENATRQLNEIPKDSFKMCFQQWRERWEKYARLQGQYFERD